MIYRGGFVVSCLGVGSAKLVICSTHAVIDKIVSLY